MKNDPFPPIRITSDAPQAQPAVAHVVLEKFVWKLLVLTAFTYVIWNERITIQIGAVPVSSDTVLDQAMQQKRHFLGFWDAFQRGEEHQIVMDSLQRWTFAIDPGYAVRHRVGQQVVDQYQQDCQAFIQKFGPVAIAEMRRFKIPASILMAQALMESDAGCAMFVRESRNYFPRTCEHLECNAEHFTDQEATVEHIHVFPGLWESFRAQCRHLTGNAALKNLIKSGETDFRVWARKLSKQNYSPDPKYAEKLIALIQAFDLDALDARAEKQR